MKIAILICLIITMLVTLAIFSRLNEAVKQLELMQIRWLKEEIERDHDVS